MNINFNVLILISELIIFFKNFYGKYSGMIKFLGPLAVSFLMNYYSTGNFIYFFFSIGIFVLLIGFCVYYCLKYYVPITLESKTISMHHHLHNNNNNYYTFKIPSLMADIIFDTRLYFKLKFSSSFKNKLNKTNYYTLVVKKNKFIDINLAPEYVFEKDIQCTKRGTNYYYIVQEYQDQEELTFVINFSFSNTINLSECKMYLEPGDIHEVIDKNINNEDSIKLKNLFYTDSFFVTNMESISNYNNN